METLDIQDQILDKLNTLIVVLNQQGEIDYVSKSARSVLGYEPDSLLGNNWWESTRFSKPEGALIKKKIMRLFKEQAIKVHHFEHELRTANGRSKWISWNVSYLNEEQLVGIGMDVSEKKNKEKELQEKTNLLHEQHYAIQSSIRYAQRIQERILQTRSYISRIFRDHFVLYNPKDLVSGDFYFFHEDENYKFVIAVDCTGHGVPGAIMSVLANSIIKEVIINKKVFAPGKILYELDNELYKSINSYSNDLSNDGMDVAVVSINKKSKRLHYAGAMRPLVLIRNGEYIEVKASRYALGSYIEEQKIFEEHVLMLQESDELFLFSDGYADQFGGELGKKFNRKQFKELLLTVASMPIEEQEGFMEYALNNWKQEEEQTDDILVIGIKP